MAFPPGSEARQTIDMISGATKGKEIGEALKNVMCKPCYINIMSCGSGSGDTIKAIAKETGCIVRGVLGAFWRNTGWNIFRGSWSQWEVEFGVIECDSAGRCTNVFVAGSTGMHVW